MSDPNQIVKCPSCGATNLGSNRFCIECSTRLEPQDTAPTVVLPSSQQQQQQPQQSGGSSKKLLIIGGVVLVVLMLAICAGGVVFYQGQQRQQAATATAQRLAAIEAETAEANAQATADADATTTAEAEANTTATAEADATATAEAVMAAATARSESTATALAAEEPPTEEPEPLDLEEPTLAIGDGDDADLDDSLNAAVTAAALVETIEATIPEEQLDEVVYGPDDGNIEHEAGYLKRVFASDIELHDFGASVVFYNPYDATEGDWDYGFVFEANEETLYYLLLDSDMSWGLSRYQDESYERMDEGSLSSLDVSDGGSNELIAIVYQGTAVMMVNEEDFVVVDVPENTEAGRVGVFTSLQIDHEIDGSVTPYEEFEVISLDP